MSNEQDDVLFGYAGELEDSFGYAPSPSGYDTGGVNYVDHLRDTLSPTFDEITGGALHDNSLAVPMDDFGQPEQSSTFDEFDGMQPSTSVATSSYQEMRSMSYVNSCAPLPEGMPHVMVYEGGGMLVQNGGLRAPPPLPTQPQQMMMCAQPQPTEEFYQPHPVHAQPLPHPSMQRPPYSSQPPPYMKNGSPLVGKEVRGGVNREASVPRGKGGALPHMLSMPVNHVKGMKVDSPGSVGGMGSGRSTPNVMVAGPSSHHSELSSLPSMDGSSALSQLPTTSSPATGKVSPSKARTVPRPNSGKKKPPRAANTPVGNTVGAVLARANKLASQPAQNSGAVRLTIENSALVGQISAELERLKSENGGREHSVRIRELENKRASIFFEALARQTGGDNPNMPTNMTFTNPKPRNSYVKSAGRGGSAASVAAKEAAAAAAAVHQQGPGGAGSPTYSPQCGPTAPSTAAISHYAPIHARPTPPPPLPSHNQQLMYRMGSGGGVGQGQGGMVQHAGAPLLPQQQQPPPQQMQQQLPHKYMVKLAAPAVGTGGRSTPSSSSALHHHQMGMGNERMRHPPSLPSIQPSDECVGRVAMNGGCVGGAPSTSSASLVEGKGGKGGELPQRAAAASRARPAQQLPPTFTPAQCAKRFEERRAHRNNRLREYMREVAAELEFPRTEDAFVDYDDALRRLLPYHFSYEPDLAQSVFDEFDAQFSRSMIEADDRLRRAKRRFQHKLLKQSMSSHDEELNLLLFLDMDYERKKLEEERLVAADDPYALVGVARETDTALQRSGSGPPSERLSSMRPPFTRPFPLHYDSHPFIPRGRPASPSTPPLGLEEEADSSDSAVPSPEMDDHPSTRSPPAHSPPPLPPPLRSPSPICAHLHLERTEVKVEPLRSPSPISCTREVKEEEEKVLPTLILPLPTVKEDEGAKREETRLPLKMRMKKERDAKEEEEAKRREEEREEEERTRVEAEKIESERRNGHRHHSQHSQHSIPSDEGGKKEKKHKHKKKRKHEREDEEERKRRKMEKRERKEKERRLAASLNCNDNKPFVPTLKIRLAPPPPPAAVRPQPSSTLPTPSIVPSSSPLPPPPIQSTVPVNPPCNTSSSPSPQTTVSPLRIQKLKIKRTQLTPISNGSSKREEQPRALPVVASPQAESLPSGTPTLPPRPPTITPTIPTVPSVFSLARTTPSLSSLMQPPSIANNGVISGRPMPPPPVPSLTKQPLQQPSSPLVFTDSSDDESAPLPSGKGMESMSLSAVPLTARLPSATHHYQ